MASAPRWPANMGERIRWARERRELTQLDLAGRLEVRQPSIVNWEKGTNAPRPATLKRLAQVLDVSPSWLMRGEGEPGPRASFFDVAPWAYLARPLAHVPVFEPTEPDFGFDPFARPPVDYVACCLKAARPFALRARDPAMASVAPLGSIVVFDAGVAELIEGGLFLVETEGRALFRRWRADPARLEAGAPGVAAIYPERRPRAIGRAILVLTPLADDNLI